MNSKIRQIRQVPFRAAHLDIIELRDQEKILLETEREKMIALADIATGGTLICEGRILGFVGFLQVREGVYEGWLIPSIYVKQYAIIFAKRIKQLLIGLEAVHPIHRIQTSAPADSLHNDWMEFLGFKWEGLMPQYSSDRRDYNMWGRLKNG